MTDSHENVEQDSALESAPDGGGSSAAGNPSKPKRERSAAQQAQFEAMRAKRWAKQKSEAARRAGVDMTADTGPDVSGLSPTAPKVTTTAYPKPPKSIEQVEREKQGERRSDSSRTDAKRDESNEPTSAGVIKAAPRSGLLAIIRDGLGL